MRTPSADRAPAPWPALLAMLALLAMSLVAPATASSQTIVTIGFDDGGTDQYQADSILRAHGLRATFFVNSGRIGRSGYMTHDQLASLQTAGHEIAGHTIGHVDLATQSQAEMRRQVCDDRAALINAGYRITSFAYPFGSHNAAAQQVVADCGYASARGVGGLGCSGCPAAEPMPPANRFATRTPASVKSSTSLQSLQNSVIAAEQRGGGWVQFVFHHICDGCTTYAVSASTLDAFARWLAQRSSSGTVVRTTDQVMGGGSTPPPPPPPPSGSNLLQNASLEVDADGNSRADCWQLGGYGTNTRTLTRTTDAHSGGFAEQLDVSQRSSGDGKLVTRQDAGACAPPAVPGHRYAVSGWYKSNVPLTLVGYYRSSSGAWTWFTQAPSAAPASSGWAQASFTTAVVPAGATHLSIGFAMPSVGQATMDDFSLVDQG